MPYDGLITSFLGQGLAAARPVAPNLTPAAIAFWWSTDTNKMSTWVEGAWVNDILSAGSGGGLLAANNLSDVANAVTARANLGLGTGAVATVDNDTTLASDSTTNPPSVHAVRGYVATAVTGLLDFKGSQDCSANPNYPAASKGDAYVVSVAGKIGGAAGASVDIGDVYFATADNAGGTQAGVGASWDILEHNLVSISSYTDEQAQDAVGGILTDTATVDFTYDDAGNTISAIVKGNSIKRTHLAAGAGNYDNVLTMPVASDFTLLNGAAGTNPATLTDYGIGIEVYQDLTPGGTAQVRFAKYNTAPSGAGFTLTARMDSIDPSNAFGQVSQKCLILRNATNGRMIIMGEGGTGSTIYVQIFSGYTSGQLGQYTAFSVGYRFPWLRIVSDGTNLNFYVSTDGYRWLKGTGTTIANYIGSVDECGIGQQVNAAGLTQGTHCQSFTLV